MISTDANEATPYLCEGGTVLVRVSNPNKNPIRDESVRRKRKNRENLWSAYGKTVTAAKSCDERNTVLVRTALTRHEVNRKP